MFPLMGKAVALLMLAFSGALSAGAAVPELVKSAQESVVVIRQGGRTGGEEGVGSGVILSADGLIATNLHVIGEGRSVSVVLPGGERPPVVEIHAWDRARDLAILRVDRTGLKPLPLSAEEKVPDGTPVVALGAPRGLEGSVVQGVISATREIDEFPGIRMLQLAVPIEPGNSGGPVIDLGGRVLGLVTVRSMRTANLGFAMPASALQDLLDHPSPVPMERWQRIGALDRRRWDAGEAEWSQRAGEIRVEGRGGGFAGRALCLWRDPPPSDIHEVAVRVALDDGSGAAGLAFCAEGTDRHYGFYPTDGALRLTRFDGPDVFSWEILAEVRTPLYRRGDWNDLRVRVEPERILCYLNGQLVIESTDARWRGGRAGLCKFRETRAGFRRFRVAAEIAPAATSERETLLAQAASLEATAARLRELARRAHEERITKELQELTGRPAFDLVRAALLIACWDQPDLDVEEYRERIHALGRDFAAGVPASASAGEKLRRLNTFFFQECGFHGARADFDDPANSHLSTVLDDREGIPISLCVLYQAVGEAAGLRIEGISAPERFLVRHRPEEGAAQVIDVFDGGTAAEDDGSLPSAGALEVVLRMLANLRNFALEGERTARALGYASLMVALQPEQPRERLARAYLAASQGEWEMARQDADYLRDRPLEEVDQANFRRLEEMLQRRQAR